MLKLTMGECLNRHYVRTKFRPNPRGQVFFCVDLTWNDPNALYGLGQLLISLDCTITQTKFLGTNVPINVMPVRAIVHGAGWEFKYQLPQYTGHTLSQIPLQKEGDY